MNEQLFQIIRSELNKDNMHLGPMDWNEVYALARSHSLVQFVSSYMNRLPEEQKPTDEIRKEIEAQHVAGQVRYVYQKVAARDIHNILETAKCDHMFLKGTVTQTRYPNPFLRSMGDIDFLYREKQHDDVKNALLDNGFTGYQEGRKNDTYFRKPYVCVEAHRQLVPSDSTFYTYCERVWERARLRAGSLYCYEMTAEDELVFNIIHLAVHFLEGGAGVRFIVDVYVYNHLMLDIDYLKNELRKLDLLEFYNNISDLAEVWFGDGEETPRTKHLGEFILKSGTFGTSENSSALLVRDGRLTYLRKMCFPSYGEMRSIYPWLKGKKPLLPVAWLLRGLRVLKHKKGKMERQIRMARTGDRKLGQKLYSFYEECGLRSKL